MATKHFNTKSEKQTKQPVGRIRKIESARPLSNDWEIYEGLLKLRRSPAWQAYKGLVLMLCVGTDEEVLDILNHGPWKRKLEELEAVNAA